MKDKIINFFIFILYVVVLFLGYIFTKTLIDTYKMDLEANRYTNEVEVIEDEPNYRDETIINEVPYNEEKEEEQEQTQNNTKTKVKTSFWNTFKNNINNIIHPDKDDKTNNNTNTESQSNTNTSEKFTFWEKIKNKIINFFTIDDEEDEIEEKPNNNQNNSNNNNQTEPNPNNQVEPNINPAPTNPEVISSNFKCDISKYTKNNNGDNNKIHYIYAGPGDAILIESNGHYGLVDSTNPSYNDGTAQAIYDDEKSTVTHVIKYLESVFGCKGNSCKGKLDFVLATHSHSDHIGGMVDIANHFVSNNTTYFYRDYVTTSDDFLYNGYSNSTLSNKAYDKKSDWDNKGYFDRSIKAMKSSGACLEELTNNDIEFSFGDMKINIFNTDTSKDDESICIKDGKQISYVGDLSKKECENKGGKMYVYSDNGNSMIALITYKNTKSLLAGDLQRPDELRLISNSKTKSLLSNIDVYKMGHHGVKSSSGLPFDKVLKPKMGIISRKGYYAKGLSVLEMRYMSNKYNTKFYILSGVKDALIEVFNKDGSYKLVNSDTKSNLNKSYLDLKSAKSEGNLYTIKYEGESYKYYFEKEDEITKTGWVKYNDKWYYVSSNGYTVVGWQKLKYKGVESWYYFDDNSVMFTGWLKHKNNWYYLGKDGAMVTGWQKLNYKNQDKWFYFNKDGVMQTGWQKLIWKDKENWYYFNDNGVMVTGWKEIEYKGKVSWFYFESDGAMVSNKCMTIKNEEFCFSESGICTKGRGCS